MGEHRADGRVGVGVERSVEVGREPAERLSGGERHGGELLPRARADGELFGDLLEGLLRHGCERGDGGQVAAFVWDPFA